MPPCDVGNWARMGYELSQASGGGGVCPDDAILLYVKVNQRIYNIDRSINSYLRCSRDVHEGRSESYA